MMKHFFECECCAHWHNAAWYGDCRDDSARFTLEEIKTTYGEEGVGWIEVPQDETHDMTKEECRQMCQEQLLASLRAVPAWGLLPEHIPRICLAAAEEIEKLRRKK